MAYKTIKICWTPHGRTQWLTYTATRVEAARLWNDLVDRHYRIRKAGWRWPSYARLARWAKGRYPNLHSHSVQQSLMEFLEAVSAIRVLRKHGVSPTEAKYPWRKSLYRDVTYTNQAAKIRGGVLFLPSGKAGVLRVKLPRVNLPEQLAEVRLGMLTVSMIFTVPSVESNPSRTIGVDLGVNTLICATDGKVALCISGRSIKASVQYREKTVASLCRLQSKHAIGSRRWRRIQWRKAKVLSKSRRQVHDKLHKATRLVANEFGAVRAFVGRPFNEAASRAPKKAAQFISSSCNGQIIRMLTDKLSIVSVVDEYFSSQTCPVCGQRQTAKRIYHCTGCGARAPRDVVGALNNKSIGEIGGIVKCRLPSIVVFKYPETVSGSSGGHPVNSSSRREAPMFGVCHKGIGA